MRDQPVPVDAAHVGYLRRRLAEVGFWFVDIPRTSSTTIKAALADRYGKLFGKRGVRQGVARGLIPDHMPLRDLHALLGPETWSRVRSVCVVRDPFERTRSLYRYRKQIEGEDLPGFDEYVERLAACVEAEADEPDGPRWRGDFDPLFRYHGHRWSACRYICARNGSFLVDAIVRFENRDEELERVARAWGVPALMPTRRKIGSTRPSEADGEDLAAARAAISNIYRDDVERLGYDGPGDGFGGQAAPG